MATNIGNAYLQIVPSAQGAHAAITKDLNNGAGSAGTTAGNTIASKIKGAIAAAGIGTALGATIKSALSEGAALEQSLGGIEAIFGDSADKVKEYAKDSWSAVGVSANAYMEGVTSFSAALIRDMGGDTDKAAEIANQAFIDMGDNANRFGKSVEEVQNVYTGLAKGQFMLLDNLNLGFAGSKQGMEDLLAYAKELTGVDYSIDSLADMYQAIHVVQEELNVTGTTAKEAATTLSGSTGAMKAAWQDLLGNMAIGESVSAPLDNLMVSISNYLGNLIPMVGNIITQLPGSIFTLVSTLGPQLLQSGAEFMRQIAGGIQENVPTLVNNAMTALTEFSTTLRANFGMFVDAGLELIQNLLKGVVDAIPGFVKQAPTIIKNFAGLINDNAPKILRAGKGIIKTLWEGIKATFKALKENWRNILDALLEVWKAINWVNLGKSVINFIKDGFMLLKTTLPGKLKEIGQSALEWFKGIDWLGLGKSIINFIKNGITALVTAIPTALKNIGTTALNGVKNIKWLDLGKSIITAIVGGFTALVTKIPSSLKSIGSKAMSAIKGLLWGKAGSDIVNQVAGGMETNDAISKTLYGLVDEAGNLKVTGALKTKWERIGKQLASGVADGINSEIPKVKQKAENLVLAAEKAGIKVAIIKSPSKLFRDHIGKQLAAGVAVGIEDYTPRVETATEDMINSALNTGIGLPGTALRASGSLEAAINSGAIDPNYAIVVNATMDGTAIKTAVSDYTITKISNEQRYLMRAQGV